MVDFRRGHSQDSPQTIDGAAVERVSSTKFLGVHISEDLSWSNNTTSLTKKAQTCRSLHETSEQIHPPSCQDAELCLLSPPSVPCSCTVTHQYTWVHGYTLDFAPYYNNFLHCCISCYWSFALLSMYIAQAALSCTSSVMIVAFAPLSLLT